MAVIANTGRREICRCIKTMYIYVGKEQQVLFSRLKTYNCTIRDNGMLQLFYKIYGDEFDLSCTEGEFNEHFVLVKNKKTGVIKD